MGTISPSARASPPWARKRFTPPDRPISSSERRSGTAQAAVSEGKAPAWK